MNDKTLNIRTEEIQSDNKHSYYNHRYEPTSYEILDLLFNEYTLSSNDTLIDYGCGKGRLNFYVNCRFHCNAIGVELNKEYYMDAIKNLVSYTGTFKHKIEFKCVPAQEYRVRDKENYFYFFNPFSIEIFRKVISNILLSIEQAPRKCTLFLFYPDNEYLFYLDNYTTFKLLEEIKLPHSKDERNCFAIYSNLCP